MSLFSPSPEVIAALRAHFSLDTPTPSTDTTNTTNTVATTNHPPAFDDTIDTLLYDPTTHSHLLPQLVDIHIACILTDNTIATFTTPIDSEKRQKMLQWWGERADEVTKGTREIVLGFAAPKFISTAVSSTSASTSASASTTDDGVAGVKSGKQLAGFVMLSKPLTETGPFRGPVEKLLVSPEFRRRGVARRVMERLEDAARAQGRWLLLVDTETDSPAELVYPRLGYIEVGKIPDYGISPVDHSLIGATFFWKDARWGKKGKEGAESGGGAQ